MGDRSYNAEGARPKFLAQNHTGSSQEDVEGQEKIERKNAGHLIKTDRPVVFSDSVDSTDRSQDNVNIENPGVKDVCSHDRSCDLTCDVASSSLSTSFLRDINEVCQDKTFTDREQILLSKWQQSGLRLWKLLHDREVKRKQKSQELPSFGPIRTQSSDAVSLTHGCDSRSSVTSLDSERCPNVTPLSQDCDSICPITSQGSAPGCCDITTETQGCSPIYSNSCQCTSLSQRANRCHGDYFGCNDTSVSQGSDPHNSTERSSSLVPNPCCCSATLPLGHERHCSVVRKTSGVTCSHCIKSPYQPDPDHPPSKVFSNDCIKRRGKSPTSKQQFKTDRDRHTGLSCDKVLVGVINNGTHTSDNVPESSHDGSKFSGTKARDQHGELLNLREHQNSASYENINILTARNEDFDDSVENDADNVEDFVSVSYKLHLLKAVDMKSPLFSSDSAVTDQSSTCEWADGSSDAVRTERNTTKPPQKHLRKKGHTRSRSTDKEIVTDRCSAIRHTPGDSDSSEDDAHIGQGEEEATSVKLYYHAQSENDEIEKYESYNYSEQQNGIKDNCQSFDDSSGSSQSGESGCYKGCGPGILRLHYAIPYLSEKLKKSLAKRIENTGKTSCDMTYTALAEDINYDVTTSCDENENLSSDLEKEEKKISSLQSIKASQDLQTVDQFQSKIPLKLPVVSESISHVETTADLSADVRNPSVSYTAVSCTRALPQNTSKQSDDVMLKLPTLSQSRDVQSQICDSSCDASKCSDKLCACCGDEIVCDNMPRHCQQGTTYVGSYTCSKHSSDVTQLDSSCENLCTSHIPDNLISKDRKNQSNVSIKPDSCHSSGDFHNHPDHTDGTEYEVHSSVCCKPVMQMLKTDRDQSIASHMPDKQMSELNKEHSCTSYIPDTLSMKCCYKAHISNAIETESFSSNCDEENCQDFKKIPNSCCCIPETYKSDKYCHTLECRKPDQSATSFCRSNDCCQPKQKVCCHSPTNRQGLDNSLMCDEQQHDVSVQTYGNHQEAGMNVTPPSVNVVSCEDDSLPGRERDEASLVTVFSTELIEKSLDSTQDSVSSDDGSVAQSLLSSLSEESDGRQPGNQELEEELSWGEPDSREGDSGESESGEADDEFECECDHCVLIRSHHPSNCQGQQAEGQGQSDNDTTQPEDRRQHLDLLLSDSAAGGLYGINVAELSPLSNLMNNRRNELEQMFENVIMQMLAVHPDLMSDQTPPPASQTVIDALPQITASKEHLGQSCPICLCLYEEQERLSCLPCQHQFHHLCIQAWLVKSGTCPVCRKVL